MKKCRLIIVLIFIVYVYCSTEYEIYDLNLSDAQRIHIEDYPDQKLPKETPLFFRIQKETEPLYIHLLLPLDVKPENFYLIYTGFKTKPTDEEIFSSEDFKNLELYDKIEYEGIANEYTYLL